MKVNKQLEKQCCKKNNKKQFPIDSKHAKELLKSMRGIYSWYL